LIDFYSSLYKGIIHLYEVDIPYIHEIFILNVDVYSYSVTISERRMMYTHYSLKIKFLGIRDKRLRRFL